MKLNLLARFAASTVAIASALPAISAELVVNGGFESGNTGFASTHYYGGTDPGPFTGGTAVSGSYWLVANAASVCGCFINETADGKFMAIDAGTSGLAVWSQTVAVAPNSNYIFSYQATQRGFGDPATIQASINGIAVGIDLTPGTSFTTASYLFNSGAASSLTLSLKDLNSSLFYNDYAIDNISLNGPAAGGAVGGVPEPATWAMLMAGFGIVGAVSRRRSGATVAS